MSSGKECSAQKSRRNFVALWKVNPENSLEECSVRAAGRLESTSPALWGHSHTSLLLTCSAQKSTKPSLMKSVAIWAWISGSIRSGQDWEDNMPCDKYTPIYSDLKRARHDVNAQAAVIYGHTVFKCLGRGGLDSDIEERWMNPERLTSWTTAQSAPLKLWRTPREARCVLEPLLGHHSQINYSTVCSIQVGYAHAFLRKENLANEKVRLDVGISSLGDSFLAQPKKRHPRV